MTKLVDFLFSDNNHVQWSGDDALTFLAVFMIIIMISSLIITDWITTQKPTSKGKAWIPTSTNIRANKPNINI